MRRDGPAIPPPAAQPMIILRGPRNFLREVMRLNMSNFRVFGPDETQSNRLEAIYDAAKKVWLGEYFPTAASWPRRAASWRCSDRVRFSSSAGGAQTATLRRVEGAQAADTVTAGSLSSRERLSRRVERHG
jgi:D-xylulose 5-phosphate/D-fructose 6-phosphate phosphoketolase